MSPQLLALASAVAYAVCIISARLGLRYSNAATVTYVSLLMHNLTLWPAVFLTRGVPEVEPAALYWFLASGSMQPVIRLMTYKGVQRIGASRSYALRASAPLFSAAVAVLLLGERATVPVAAGTLSIVAGIFVISWQGGGAGRLRWLDWLLPLGAALLAGIAQPIRRHALSISNEPLFFAAVVGLISIVWYLAILELPAVEKPVWEKKALAPFVFAGVFEALGIWLGIASLSSGTVMVVTPIVATSPMWVLIFSAVFLRGVERVTLRIAAGTLAVVAGTVTIALGG